MKIKLLIVLTVFFKIANTQSITANFTGCNSGCSPLFTHFTDLSTSSNGPIINWQWIFQGGTPPTSTIQNPSVIYNTPGTYSVSLIVTNSNGDKDTSVSAACAHVYTWPSAGFVYTLSGTTVTCTATLPSGIVSHIWLFGDGSPQDVNASPVHTYSIANTYKICHQIEDKNGCWDSTCQSLIISSVNEKYLENFITISPNPFSTQTTLKTDNLIKNATLVVYNSFGQQVKQIKNISEKTATFHRDNLPSGVYLIRLLQDNKPVAVSKLIIIDN